MIAMPYFNIAADLTRPWRLRQVTARRPLVRGVGLSLAKDIIAFLACTENN